MCSVFTFIYILFNNVQSNGELLHADYFVLLCISCTSCSIVYSSHCVVAAAVVGHAQQVVSHTGSPTSLQSYPDSWQVLGELCH